MTKTIPIDEDKMADAEDFFRIGWLSVEPLKDYLARHNVTTHEPYEEHAVAIQIPENLDESAIISLVNKFNVKVDKNEVKKKAVTEDRKPILSLGGINARRLILSPQSLDRIRTNIKELYQITKKALLEPENTGVLQGNYMKYMGHFNLKPGDNRIVLELPKNLDIGFAQRIARRYSGSKEVVILAAEKPLLVISVKSFDMMKSQLNRDAIPVSRTSVSDFAAR